ncbi:O-antigen ligase family protein [Paenibacillus macerans]|uniref:O-Antigen ligase family protein n=1 Tax=Paenibacillus macerans TaxID=44252 RepID=A0A090ZCA2_PAEMA|nr:O-antigen ligase family protein [Paenibacillus macerans]KFN07850.1 O-Antigen ligase family protein [Paenibacillus macerans]MCY7561604.1 O-antigen ligase family protein [Paenibacillus macerans]MEC0153362.1 O-antigen ligase family protein [Paenibacillus macerans]SUD25908.1 O-antigen polymerase [Paenibacillus macerans]
MSNPVYGKMAVESRIREKLPAALWLLLVGLIMFLVWAPFQAGVFNGLVLNFEQPIYWSVLVGSILLLVWAAAFFKNIKLEDQRDWTALLVLLIPITYIIALISAASQYFASNMVLIQSLYAFMFIMGLYLLQNHKANRMIETTLITVAYVIVLFGLFNWLGQGRTVSAIVGWFSGIVVDGQYTQAVWVDANGPRLASVFQYPNTYAAFLMAFFFIAVFGITRSKKWYGQAIHAFMLVPMVLSILLTLSRGGLVFLPVVFVVLLLFLKPAKQILWIVYCVLAGVATLVIAKPVTNLGQQFHLGQINDPAKGWFYVLGASLALAVIAWLIQRYAAPRLESGLSRWADRKLSSLWLPVVSVVVVGILAWLFLGTNLKHILPGNIGERLENLNLQQHSFLERMTFYKDAVKVLKDYPIIGAGGGAWASIFEKYQNNPYSSRQAHSFVMQYLVETGLLGFIIFVAFLIFIFYKYIRGYIKAGEQERDSYFAYFILVFSILIHSLMDFNMSFVFISMLVFLGLGGMAAVMDNRPVAKLKLKPGTMRGLYSTVMVLASIVLIFVSIRYIGASQDVVKAKNLFTTSNDFQEIKTPLDKALSKRGDHPDAVLYMSSLLQAVYSQTKDESFYNEELNLLTNTLKKEPFDKNMYKQLMTLYQSNSENDKAYAVLRDNADRYAYDMNWYEQLIVQSYELGYQALGQQDTAKKDDYFKTGLAAYQHVVAGVEHLKTLPKGQLQGNPFEITQPMVLNAGKMQYMLNDPAKAAEIFKVGIKDDLNDGTNREIARWYLAALQKNGTTDQAVYDRLLQMDPNEKGEIDKITQQNF